MTQKNQHAQANTKKAKKNNGSSQSKRSPFSQAIMTIAKANLKEFEAKADEAFLIRADIDRKLSSL